MRILLSIKPEFAEKIFDGSKKYEFRRVLFKNPAVTTVVVYASSPVQKVIGEFSIEGIVEGDLQSLWRKTKKHAGISEESFYSYFSEKEIGFAIRIDKVKKYDKELSLIHDFKMTPPQSFVYLDGAFQ